MMLFSFSGKEWLLSRMRRLQTFKILHMSGLCAQELSRNIDIYSPGLCLTVLLKMEGEIPQKWFLGSVKKIESLIRSFVFRRWPKKPSTLINFQKKSLALTQDSCLLLSLQVFLRHGGLEYFLTDLWVVLGLPWLCATVEFQKKVQVRVFHRE